MIIVLTWPDENDYRSHGDSENDYRSHSLYRY